MSSLAESLLPILISKERVSMGKTFRHYIIFYASISSTYFFCMDAPSGPDPIVIRELTIVHQPWLAGFLAGNKALLGNHSGYNIIDIDENKTIVHIPLLALRFVTNQNKSLIGFQTRDKFLIYNVNLGTSTWESSISQGETIHSSVFTADDRFWILQNGMVQSDHGDSFIVPETKNITLNVSCDPTEKKIFFTHEKKITKNFFCQIALNQKKPIVHSIELPHRLLANVTDNRPQVTLHSPVADVVGLYYAFDGNWSLYNYKKKIIRIIAECKNLAFHPTRPIVALLMVNKTLQLYDFAKETIINKAKIDERPYTSGLNQRSMDFSLNGKQLIFILKDQCFLADMPNLD